MSETYYGYSLYRPLYAPDGDELIFVVKFETEYKARKSVLANLDRCIYEQTGIKGESITGLFSYWGEEKTQYPVIHKSSVESNIDELIERKECQGSQVELLETVVYVVPKEKTSTQVIKSLARDYGVALSMLEPLVNSITSVCMIDLDHDQADAIAYIEQFIKRYAIGARS